MSEGVKPDLKVVGEIKPADYKTPATMLRNIADDIEAGEYGDVETLAVALRAENGYETFGGGPASSLQDCAFLFAACAARLHILPWGRPSE